MASRDDQTRHGRNTPPSSEKESNPNGENHPDHSVFQGEEDLGTYVGTELSLQDLDGRYVTLDILKKEISTGVTEVLERFSEQQDMKAQLQALKEENARLKAQREERTTAGGSEAPAHTQAVEYSTPVIPNIKTTKVKHPTPRDKGKNVETQIIPLEREKSQARRYRNTPKPLSIAPRTQSMKGPFRFHNDGDDERSSHSHESEDVRALIERKKSVREASSMDARTIIQRKRE